MNGRYCIDDEMEKELEKYRMMKRLQEFIKEDDMTFFEAHILNLPMDEQRNFFEDNPKFLQAYSITIDSLDLLQDSNYRNIRRRIKELSEER